MQEYVLLHNSGRWSIVKAISAEEAAKRGDPLYANVQVVELIVVQTYDLKLIAVRRQHG